MGFFHNVLPPGFTDPVLCAFTNAILHCSSSAEVCLVLNDATTNTGEAAIEAPSNQKILSDYAAFMAETKTKLDCFYDESALPHTKESIIAAIEGAIAREKLDERVELLKIGAVFLWNFQCGVGATPLPLTGLDVSQFPRGNTTEERERLKRMLSDPNLKHTQERADRLRATADAEAKEIERRLSVAIQKSKRLRG
jgi:hypothetical protein